MTRRLLRLLSLALIPGLCFSVPLAAQEDDEGEDLKEQVEAKTTEAEEAYKTGELGEILKDLAGLYAQTEDKKLRNEIVSTVGRGLGAREEKVRVAAASALADFGEDAIKFLDGGIKKSKEQDVRIALIEAMGKLQHPKLVPTLTRLLNDKDDTIIAKATESLGKYKDADLRTRIQIFEELHKIYMSAESGANDARNTTAVRKNGIIRDPMNTALANLSGQSLATAEAWRKWFSDAKKNPRAWPKGKDEEKGDTGGR